MKKNTKNLPKKHIVQIQIQTDQIIPTVHDLQPIHDGGKYMIPRTWISEKQVLRMIQKTPAQHVYTRPAKGGGSWMYVTGHYVEKVLNYTFGWNWDFEIMNHGKEGDMIWVLGKLTVKDDHDHQISKSQFGRKEIRYKKDSKIMLDYGNDLKGAATDAMKKCASLLGIASDIYGKEEFREETGKQIEEVINKKNSKQSDDEITWICEKCKNPVDDHVKEFSQKIYKKTLCRECQIEKKKSK